MVKTKKIREATFPILGQTIDEIRFMTSFELVSSSSGGQEQSSGALDPCASELPLVLSGSSSGTIQSPNYPSDYPNDADCNWVVEVGGGVVVELTIVTFDVEDG